MNVANALSLVNVTEIAGLLIVGALFGWLVYPSVVTTPVLSVGFVTITLGLTFFLFTIILRYLTVPVDQAERTIGTALLWVVFSGSVIIGMRAEGRHHG